MVWNCEDGTHPSRIRVASESFGRGREGCEELCGMGRSERSPRRDKPKGEMGNMSTAFHRL